MTADKRTPLMLVVDDQEEWREKIIPAALEPLGVRYLKARTVREALRIACEHTRDAPDPLDMVVLDMHLPLDESRAAVVDEGGIEFLRRYKLVECPVVVFTAYASYANCVASVKAGAAGYVSKYRVPTSEKGGKAPIEELMTTVRALLAKEPEGGAGVFPTAEWMERNYPWLVSRFGGKWVTIVSAKAASDGGLRESDNVAVSEGVAVVSGGNYAAVRREVIERAALFVCLPPIVFVPGAGEDEAEAKKEGRA